MTLEEQKIMVAVNLMGWELGRDEFK